MVISRVFFFYPGAPSKIDGQLSVIILLIVVSKQKLLFLQEGAILQFFSGGRGRQYKG